jgi:hypothetical protein
MHGVNVPGIGVQKTCRFFSSKKKYLMTIQEKAQYFLLYIAKAFYAD